MKQYTVITGASSGIGHDAAIAFAQRGKHLILIARRKDKLISLKKMIHNMTPAIDVIIKAIDLTQTEKLVDFFHNLESYNIETWINNAGVGMYSSVAEASTLQTTNLLQLNIEAVTILSTLYVSKYQHIDGTQLINISSSGGYTLVPHAITYCASKFFVSAFTEGLALELSASKAPLKAKVLAPSATETEFGKLANNVTEYDYKTKFQHYHSSQEMAQFLLELYDSDQTVGLINRETFTLELSCGLFASTFNSPFNQK